MKLRPKTEAWPVTKPDAPAVLAMGPVTQPWHLHLEGGARLSKSKQMAAWIVQQVPLQTHPCLACTALPHQTPLIIDVLEWPHHHQILQNGRNIKVITAAPKLLLSSKEWCWWCHLMQPCLEMHAPVYFSLLILALNSQYEDRMSTCYQRCAI